MAIDAGAIVEVGCMFVVGEGQDEEDNKQLRLEVVLPLDRAGSIK